MSPDVAQDNTVTLSEGLQAFSVQWELFCAEMASGNTAAGSAVSAGYSPRYAEELKLRPEVQARIQELRRERAQESGLVTRVWVECKLVQIANRSMEDRPATADTPAEPPNYAIAQTALMNIAKLRGWIVERKQVATARIERGTSSMEAALDQQLAELSPGERQRIKELAQGKGRLTDLQPSRAAVRPSKDK